MDFSETIVVYDIKVGMNIKGHQVTQIQHFQVSFAQKLLGRLKPNFIWRLHGMWGMKICSNISGHMTMPIYGEKLQNSSSEPRGR